VTLAFGLVGAAFFTIRTSGDDPAVEQRTPSLPEQRVRVEILNGGGVPGAAARATDLARAAGYDVVYFGNASTFEHTESEVVDRVGRTDFARGVAEVLGIDSLRSELDEDLYVDLSVILGQDWQPPDAPGDDSGTPEPPPNPDE
jgi:hypothetical protein